MRSFCFMANEMWLKRTNEGPFLFLICFFVNKFPLLLPFSPYGEWCHIFLVQIGRTLTVCHCIVVVIITFLVQIWTNNLLKKVLAFPTFSSRKLMNHFKCYAVAAGYSFLTLLTNSSHFIFYQVSPLSEGWRYFLTVCICRLVPAENAPRGDKLSASVSKGKKNKEGKESRSSKGQAGSRPSSQVTC